MDMFTFCGIQDSAWCFIAEKLPSFCTVKPTGEFKVVTRLLVLSMLSLLSVISFSLAT